MSQQNEQELEASMSLLIMSVASSAAVSLGLSPEPSSGQMQVDRHMAKFNIDLLMVLQEKTKNNLTSEEQKLLDTIVQDLKLKFVQMKK